MSKALSVATSKRSVVIKRVGKYGKVRMEEEACTSQMLTYQGEDQVSQAPQINIQFSGNFNNCTFTIDR